MVQPLETFLRLVHLIILNQQHLSTERTSDIVVAAEIPVDKVACAVGRLKSEAFGREGGILEHLEVGPELFVLLGDGPLQPQLPYLICH